jgi:predicted NUDIX family NTP pyrophosphohydrolase
MAKKSAGLVLYRDAAGSMEVFLVHPGGPFWAKKDDAAWSIPKGEIAEGEDPLEAAKREFTEETSFAVNGAFEALEPVKQASGKIIYAWSLAGDIDASAIRSNTFSMEWPPRSGKTQEFAEVDRGAWFDLAAARKKIVKGQIPLLEQLQEKSKGKSLAKGGG